MICHWMRYSLRLIIYAKQDIIIAMYPIGLGPYVSYKHIDHQQIEVQVIM